MFLGSMTNLGKEFGSLGLLDILQNIMLVIMSSFFFFFRNNICMGTGLSYDTNEPVLKEVFGHYGEIIEAKVICDHKSGKSKGYGFVHFIYKDSASKALAEMDGEVLGGRNIRIQNVNKKEGCCNLNLEVRPISLYTSNFT
ncbi:glycine-rich RNA-binding protein 2, mitochondrial-like [Helianthus annuus]|uniref:glycine-rich RNA-binding protein 2, mitochondrial-like n=1 Tax=Helianthus annuus TaxID=4232 RepID=UPI0016533510|nr:glycine-rich RNA-binding protein 2, mitochondrial-like [Helianthus annuus]